MKNLMSIQSNEKVRPNAKQIKGIPKPKSLTIHRNRDTRYPTHRHHNVKRKAKKKKYSLKICIRLALWVKIVFPFEIHIHNINESAYI